MKLKNSRAIASNLFQGQLTLRVGPFSSEWTSSLTQGDDENQTQGGCKLWHWLFGRGADVFRRDGITTVRSHGSTDTHRKYLERIGFRPTDDPATT